MKKKRRSKNTTYICLDCFKAFFIQHKEFYPYKYGRLYFCSLKCQKRFIEFENRGKRLGLEFKLRSK